MLAFSTLSVHLWMGCLVEAIASTSRISLTKFIQRLAPQIIFSGSETELTEFRHSKKVKSSLSNTPAIRVLASF
jgi:hypothetical protein